MAPTKVTPAKVTPAKVTPSKVTPSKVKAPVTGVVPDPVEELQMGALSVTVKATHECSKCKKTYKNDGVWFQNHVEKCGTLGYVDPDDTVSENGTGLG